MEMQILGSFSPDVLIRSSCLEKDKEQCRVRAGEEYLAQPSGGWMDGQDSSWKNSSSKGWHYRIAAARPPVLTESVCSSQYMVT